MTKNVKSNRPAKRLPARNDRSVVYARIGIVRALALASVVFTSAAFAEEPLVAPPPPPLTATESMPAPAPLPVAEEQLIPPAPPPLPANVQVDQKPQKALSHGDRSFIGFMDQGGRDDDSAMPAAEPMPAAQAPAVQPGPTEGGAATAPAQPAAQAPAGSFVKGELTSSMGLGQMMLRKTRFMVSGGYNKIGPTHYGLVYPQIGLKFGDFSLGLGAPLNVEFFDSAYPKNPPPGDNHIIGFKNAGKLRKQDWDEASEYARVLTYLTYGRKEDKVYLDVGQRHVSTLGHGTIMRRYAPNIDVASTRVGAQFDAYNDYLGFEAMTNDVMRWSILGVLGFVKPLTFLGADSTFAKSVSLGFTFAADREAPTRLTMSPEPPCAVPGRCTDSNVLALDENNRLVAARAMLPIWGVDLEAKIVKTANVDLKPYIDFSQIGYSDDEGNSGGSGVTLGMLGRFNAGEKTRHAFRLVGELRFLGAGYRPGYFDTFYEIDKLLMGGTGGVPAGMRLVPNTKLQSTVGRYAPPKRTGYYFEASYGVPDTVGLTLALEGQTLDPSKNFIAHLEVPAFSILRVFGSFYKRGFTDMGTITRLDDHAIAYAGARMKLLPFLFLSARAFKAFELDGEQTSDGPIGTLQYQNSWGFSGDLELGVEL